MKLKAAAFFLMIIFISCTIYSADMTNRKNVEIIKVLREQKRGATRSVVRNAQSKSSSAANKSMWIKLSALYMSNPEWADEIQIKFYVLCFNKDGNKGAKSIRDLFTLLTGSVKYINVPASKENRGEVFIHPYTIDRYGEIMEVRVEIWYKGMLESFMNESYSSRKQENLYGRQWWTQFPVRDGELLNRYYTPFIHDPDNAFEVLKLS